MSVGSGMSYGGLESTFRLHQSLMPVEIGRTRQEDKEAMGEERKVSVEEYARFIHAPEANQFTKYCEVKATVVEYIEPMMLGAGGERPDTSGMMPPIVGGIERRRVRLGRTFIVDKEKRICVWSAYAADANTVFYLDRIQEVMLGDS